MTSSYASIHTVIIHINQWMQSHQAGKLAFITNRARLTSFVKAHRSKVVLCTIDKTWSSTLLEIEVRATVICSAADLTQFHTFRGGDLPEILGVLDPSHPPSPSLPLPFLPSPSPF
jgi:hypothetical protein